VTRRSRPLAALLVAVLTGCLSERVRLDAPLVELVVTDSVVAPGDSVRGYIEATDASGIIYFAVVARAADSVSRLGPFNLVRADSVRRDFRLRVPRSAAAGSRVEVIATVIDNQNFTVELRDTLVVRGTPRAAADPRP
jgi:hypothetical protein